MKQHEIARLQSLLDNGDALLIIADDIQDLITALEEAMTVAPHLTKEDVRRAMESYEHHKLAHHFNQGATRD